MQLNLGTKIRELRRRDGRTQDVLAEALGVTAQAVSRWESGLSYPDMEMIPAIANYFHISIDALFGYHDDREEKIKNILENATEILTKQGFSMQQGGLSEEVLSCVDMLREAAEEFPNEPKILLKLAQGLQMWGWNVYGARGYAADDTGIIEYDAEYNAQNIYWQEAVRVYEKLLRSGAPMEDREIAIPQVTLLYCKMGQYEKAKALAEEQNSLAISKELLLPMATAGGEKARYQGERILALLGQLHFAISESVALRPAVFSSEYGKQLLLSVIHMYQTIFADGRCGRRHYDICHLYLTLAHYEISGKGDSQTLLAYFDKAFDHYKAYQEAATADEYKYSAPLLSDLKALSKGDLPPIGQGFWKKELQNYPQELQNALGKNPKYAECLGT